MFQSLGPKIYFFLKVNTSKQLDPYTARTSSFPFPFPLFIDNEKSTVEHICDTNNESIINFVRDIRSKYINTSDLQMQEWCGQQMVYNIAAKYGVVPVQVSTLRQYQFVLRTKNKTKLLSQSPQWFLCFKIMCEMYYFVHVFVLLCFCLFFIIIIIFLQTKGALF